MLRFILGFAACTVLFQALLMTPLAEQRLWPGYLRVNASAAGAMLRGLGYDATVDDRVIRSPQAALLIERGCDAIQPSALFVAAVLASPVAFGFKLPGILAGTAFLMLLNLVRIVSLFWIRVRFPAAFEVMHVEVWQALFIFLAVLLWAWWAVWARRRSTAGVGRTPPRVAPAG